MIDHLRGSVLAHLAAHLAELLPEPLTLVATADQMVLAAVEGRRTRTLVTQSVISPERLDEGGIGTFARGLLAGVQDMVSMHLHTPWPLTSDGRATHATAAYDGQIIDLGFRATASAGDENDIRIAPLTVRPA